MAPSVTVSVAAAGLAFNFLFFACCMWRSYVTLCNTKDIRDYKVILHLSLLCFSTFEFIYSASVLLNSGHEAESWGYSLHLFALLFYMTSFCLVYTKWEETIQMSRSKILFSRSAALINISNFTATLPYIVVTLAHTHGSAEKSTELASILIESCCLFFSTVWIFGYKIRLHTKLKLTSPQHYPDSFSLSGGRLSWNASNPLLRLNVVLSICSICYGMRFMCLVILSFDVASGSSITSYSTIAWFIFSKWIPLLIPGFIFLYTTRSGSSPSRTMTELQRAMIDTGTDVSDSGGTIGGRSASVTLHTSSTNMMTSTAEGSREVSVGEGGHYVYHDDGYEANAMWRPDSIDRIY